MVSTPTWTNTWLQHSTRWVDWSAPSRSTLMPRGYKALLVWLEGFGQVTKVGVEGTGSYGVGLSRFLRRKGVEVVEVNRPNRQSRRNQGKSDPLDAVEAARAAISGRASGAGKTKDGPVEAIRVLGGGQALGPTGPGEGHRPDASSGNHRP